MKRINKLAIYLGFFVIVTCLMYVSWYKHVSYFYPALSVLFLVDCGILLQIVRIFRAEVYSENKLRHMAYHDPLTGLENRRGLEQYLNDLIKKYKDHQNNFAVIILDLDFFKNINDSLGHDTGDALLKIIAERLKNTVRAKDLVARIGGDEFVVVINETKNTDSIGQIAQKILNSLLKTINIKERELYITTSIGISVFPSDGENIENLMKSADMALYRAKEKGRNNYQFCTLDMTQKAQQKAAWQTAMSHGLVKEEFLLYYQPSINMQSQKVVSVEALLRWQSKEYGLVTPDSIISIAEESGLIVPLSEWVLRTACKQIKFWQQQGYLVSLAINISGRQFKDANFSHNIIQILKETELNPQFLELEIKESLIMHDPDNARVILEKLKAEGVHIVIDDFGTGFSSFGYLTNNIVDKIKMDKSFIQKLEENVTNLAGISAMIAMAKKLNIKIVAEGVETKQQFDLLLQEGCDEIQGYYIAKPLPNDLMESFLAIKMVGATTEWRAELK